LESRGGSLSILEEKLRVSSNTYFCEILKIMDLYCGLVGVVDARGKEMSEMWNACMREPGGIKKFDAKFQANYGYLRNEVAKYDVLKKKLNVNNVRSAVVNYDEKKRKFETELKKKRYINIRKSVSNMD
jgi:hypothetical protein